MTFGEEKRRLENLIQNGFPYLGSSELHIIRVWQYNNVPYTYNPMNCIHMKVLECLMD